MPHVRCGPWLTHDTITLCLWRQRAPHGIFAAEAHVYPQRREQEIEELPQDNMGIDPPQDLTHPHPEAVNLGKTPGPGERQDNQDASQEETPETEGLTPPHRWPYANQSEDAPDNEPE